MATIPLMRAIICGLLLVVGCCGAAPTRPVANYDEAQVSSYTLPDPLRGVDGNPVRDAAAWRDHRRTELLELFAREVYGRTPAGRPAAMHWKVTSVDRRALGGKAVRKEITIWFTAQDTGPQMQVLLYVPIAKPEASTRWPVFVGLNFFGNASIHRDPNLTLTRAWMRANPQYGIVDNHATEATRGSQASAWQVETLIDRGYAVATAFSGDVCPDEVEGPTKNVGAMFGLHAMSERQSDTWGAIGIWAWGLSRALDYLVADPDLDPQRVIVHGHSRLGKAALWAAAQDERFAMAISNESGCGGAKLSRRRYGQTVEDIVIPFAYWFAPKFAEYGANPNALPVDQHELLALIAPRPLYVASAAGDRWSDPRGEFLGLKAAEPVYALFGKKPLPTREQPPLEMPVASDALGYHVRAGPHDITAYDWAQYLDFADRHLPKTNAGQREP